jgi:hypothetical protein
MRTIQNVVDRLRGEYLEMPGLVLKPEQVQRLCGIERTVCQLVLDALLDEKFLRMRPDGHYARLAEGHVSRPRMAKADLKADKPMAKSS